MMGYGHGWMNGYGGFGGSIMMIIFWVLIIVGIVYLIKNLSNDRNNNKRNYSEHRSEDNAVNIARERYAKGEITKEELDEIINELRNH